MKNKNKTSSKYFPIRSVCKDHDFGQFKMDIYMNLSGIYASDYLNPEIRKEPMLETEIFISSYEW